MSKPQLTQSQPYNVAAFRYTSTYTIHKFWCPVGKFEWTSGARFCVSYAGGTDIYSYRVEYLNLEYVCICDWRSSWHARGFLYPAVSRDPRLIFVKGCPTSGWLLEAREAVWNEVWAKPENEHRKFAIWTPPENYVWTSQRRS